MINLKESNQHISFLHFEMKSFQYLKTLLHKNEHSCKLDLWTHNYVFHFLRTAEREWCFGKKDLSTSSFAFALALHHPHAPKRLLEIPMTLLRRIEIQLVIWLDNMLIICKAKAQQDKLILVLGIWYKSEEVRDDPV